jgi:hypothetical protein
MPEMQRWHQNCKRPVAGENHAATGPLKGRPEGINIYRHTVRAYLRERFLALEGEGITSTGQPSRQGIALFSKILSKLSGLGSFLLVYRPRLARDCQGPVPPAAPSIN